MLSTVNKNKASFGNNPAPKPSKLKAFLGTFSLKQPSQDEFAPRQVSLEEVKRKIKEIKEFVPVNKETKDAQGRIVYFSNIEDRLVENIKIDGVADIASGTLKDSKAQSMNSYGSSMVLNCSVTDTTYVGENAKLTGGEHSHLNIQGKGAVSDVRASSAILFYDAKLSNSHVQGDVEANDFAVLKNIKANKINMNSCFARLKGKNNQCNKLEATMLWRIFHLDFRQKI